MRDTRENKHHRVVCGDQAYVFGPGPRRRIGPAATTAKNTTEVETRLFDRRVSKHRYRPRFNSPRPLVVVRKRTKVADKRRLRTALGIAIAIVLGVNAGLLMGLLV